MNEVRDVFVLLSEDDRFRQTVKARLKAQDRELFHVGTLAEAMAEVRRAEPSLILLDMKISEVPALRAIGALRERAPRTPLVAVAENSSVKLAIEALRHGAVDFVSLDEPPSRWNEAVSRALQEATSSARVEQAREQVKDRYGFTHMLTQSPRMLDVFDQIRSVAQTDATVLILGETGTGKELITRAIHERSRRKDKPFIAVNCGAFTESLLESELFGHERGSFTGAVGRREGLFEMADGGTLFLDELGETSLNVQVNLLRVLEEMAFRRVGGRDQVRIDVRILAATNVHLGEAVSEGKFRSDLYYRLNVFPIRLPPLRERREDIPLLMRHFIDEIAEEYHLEPPVVSMDAMNTILEYHWPGNVRQLRAMCERWVIIRSGQRLEREHLPSDMTGIRTVEPSSGFYVEEGRPLVDSVERAIQQVERAYFARVLRRFGGQIEKTAEHAGISRRTLYTKMKSYGLDAEEFRGS